MGASDALSVPSACHAALPWLSLICSRLAGILIDGKEPEAGTHVSPLKYAALVFILIAASSIGLSLGRLWRHRPTAIDAGTLSERWLAGHRREDS